MPNVISSSESQQEREELAEAAARHERLLTEAAHWREAQAGAYAVHVPLQGHMKKVPF